MASKKMPEYFTGHLYERKLEGPDGSFFLFANGFSLLANNHFTPFVVDGVRYLSMEQYLHAEKALFFKDYAAHKRFMAEPSPRKYKDIKIKGEEYYEWREEAPKIMERGLKKKFECHEDARTDLQLTGKSHIVYATLLDRINGSGLRFGDDKNAQKSEWRGYNELGELLTKVRDEL